MRRIGVLVGLAEGDSEGEGWVKTLDEGLARLGWKRDTNLQIDLRWGGSDADRTQKLAKELVALQPDVIQVTTTPATAAILRETHTIPVVFASVSDPIGSGFIQSLARPGGNATGFINIEASVAGKWLEILKAVAPSTARAAIVFNPKTAPQSFYQKALETSAETLGLTLTVVQVASPQDIEAAINDLAKLPNGGLVITPDIFTAAQSQRDLIISLAARLRVPAVYAFRLFVKAGGLVSYGPDNTDLLRRAAGYVDRILKGDKPEDLAVQLPTKFEMAINTRTATALGVKFPPSILATADEVIE
jgi:putative ABC transport system substrate-binding protein